MCVWCSRSLAKTCVYYILAWSFALPCIIDMQSCNSLTWIARKTIITSRLIEMCTVILCSFIPNYSLGEKVQLGFWYCCFIMNIFTDRWSSEQEMQSPNTIIFISTACIICISIIYFPLMKREEMSYLVFRGKSQTTVVHSNDHVKLGYLNDKQSSLNGLWYHVKTVIVS